MDLAEAWNTGPIKKKKQLARNLGYKSEWAEINYEDLNDRSGGMFKRDLDKLYGIYKKKK